jgi:hypothetical protein
MPLVSCFQFEFWEIALKILFHSQYKDEVENAKILLMTKGIPAYIGSESFGPALGFMLANKYTLWCCLDPQYTEALRVIDDPSYEVSQSVDMEEYQSYFDAAAGVLMRQFVAKTAPWAIAAMALFAFW